MSTWTLLSLGCGYFNIPGPGTGKEWGRWEKKKQDGRTWGKGGPLDHLCTTRLDVGGEKGPQRWFRWWMVGYVPTCVCSSCLGVFFFLGDEEENDHHDDDDDDEGTRPNISNGEGEKKFWDYCYEDHTRRGRGPSGCNAMDTLPLLSARDMFPIPYHTILQHHNNYYFLLLVLHTIVLLSKCRTKISFVFFLQCIAG